MLVLLFACAPSPVDSAGASDPLADWTHVQLGAMPISSLVAGDDTLWALGSQGQVLDLAADGVLLGGAGLSGLGEPAMRDGQLWARDRDHLVHWEVGWDLVDLPDPVSLDALAIRADGAVVGVYTHTDCDPCEGPGAANDVLTWDGTTWTKVNPPTRWETIHAAAMLQGDQLVGVGTRGLVATWDGADWRPLATGTEEDLFDIAARGDALVAVGGHGVVVQGTLGALETLALGDEALVDVDIGEGGQAWALGATVAWTRGDGGWVSVPLPEDEWTDLVVGPDGRAIVLGHNAGPRILAVDRDGASALWHQEGMDPPVACWPSPDGTLWLIAHDGAVAHWVDGHLGVVRLAPNPMSVDALAGRALDDVLLVGHETAWGWDGDTWTEIPLAPATSLHGAAVAADGAWEPDPAPFPSGLRSVWSVLAFASDDAWVRVDAGGSSDRILAWDGQTWATPSALEDLDPAALWGRADDDLVVLESDDDQGPSTLWSWDGHSLARVEDVPLDARDVTGTRDLLLFTGYAPAGAEDEDRPHVAWALAEGAWTPLAEGEETLGACSHGDTLVLFDEDEAWILGG